MIKVTRKNTKAPSVKFPGWIGHTTIIYHDGVEHKREFFMTHERYSYAISVDRYGDICRTAGDEAKDWHGEILVRRKCPLGTGNTEWGIPRNDYSGPLAKVVAEAERRGAYWEKEHATKVWA